MRSSKVFTFFGEPTLNNFTLILISLFVLFYVLKNVLSVGLTYIQTSYAMRNASTLAQALLASYMHAPYETHMGTDSSSVIVTIHEFVGRIFNDYLIPIMTLATEILASIAIVGMLFLVEPQITSVVALAFLVGVAIFYLSLKDRFHSYGKEIVATTKGCYVFSARVCRA